MQISCAEEFHVIYADLLPQGGGANPHSLVWLCGDVLPKTMERGNSSTVEKPDEHSLSQVTRAGDQGGRQREWDLGTADKAAGPSSLGKRGSYRET